MAERKLDMAERADRDELVVSCQKSQEISQPLYSSVWYDTSRDAENGNRWQQNVWGKDERRKKHSGQLNTTTKPKGVPLLLQYSARGRLALQMEAFHDINSCDV